MNPYKIIRRSIKINYEPDKILSAIGLMSGTSLDGIDVAYLSSDGHFSLEKKAAQSYSYDLKFRKQLEDALQTAKQVKNRTDRPGNLRQVERELTLRHADAVRVFLEQNSLRASEIDIIGFHGQTVLHRPQEGLTLQLGDGPLLANETGISVVYDMRANDMANGGQGAPLAPAYHLALAENFDGQLVDQKPVCFVNIGGISNLTCVALNQEPVAFDCGPGNVLIDQWVAAHKGAGADLTYDKGGELALKGRVIDEIAEDYIQKFERAFNDGRSLDRLDFAPLEKGSCNLEDGARTLAYVTARLIAQSTNRLAHMPKLCIISGGGRLNAAILHELELALPKHCTVKTAGNAGLNGDFMEAEAWGYLAIRSLKGLNLTFPGTTGVKLPCTGGVLARTN